MRARARVCVSTQRRRVFLQVFDQHQRHRDVERKRDVAVDGDISQLVRHRRHLLPVRRTELLHAVCLVDLRRFTGMHGTEGEF